MPDGLSRTSKPFNPEPELLTPQTLKPASMAAHEREEFIARLQLRLEYTQHSARHRVRVLLLHSAHHHAKVLSFKDHGDALWPNRFFNGV